MAETNYYGIQPNNVRDVENRYRYISSSGQTTFPANYAVGYVDVYYGGVKLDPATAFTAVNGLSVILSNAATAGVTVEIISRRQVAVTTGVAIPSVSTSMYTATAGQTLFKLGSGVYTPGSGSLLVYMNGLKLRSGVDYTETSTTSFTLTTGASLGDEIDSIVGNIIGPSGFNASLAPVVELYTVTVAGQTVFTTANTYSPAVNTLDVYVNGFSCSLGIDYIETSGNSITFTTGLNLNDELKFKIWRANTSQNIDSSLTTYTPPFTGAVSTTVSKELSRRINIWDFADANALGLVRSDGNPDWTTAIQAAVNYIQNLGTTRYVSTHPTTLYFPGGLYYMFGTVTITGAMSFEGDGGPSAFTGTNLQVGTADTVTPAHTLFTFATTDPVSLYFSKMSFNDNGTVYTPGCALITCSGTGSKANSIYFRDCWFKTLQSVQYAVAFVSPMADVQFLGCTFDNTAHTALILGSQLTWSGVSIIGTAGQFSCSSSPTPLAVGSQITISGTLGGTGSISGYVSGTTYVVTATNGSTTFTLGTPVLPSGTTPLVTTTGTPTGLTYSYNCGILNLSVIGCEFYSPYNSLGVLGQSFMEVYYVMNGVIANNRFWVDAGKTMPSAIKFTSANSTRVSITGNTSQGCTTFLSITGSYNVVSNNTAWCLGTPLIILGGSPFNYNSITGNTFTGAPSSGNGVIDAAGVTLNGTVIQGNSLQGNTLGPGLNMSPSNYTVGGNSIRNNSTNGVTLDGANGTVSSFTPSLGYTGTAGTFNYSTTSPRTGNCIVSNGFVTISFTIALSGVAGTAGTGRIAIYGLPMPVASTARGSVLLGGITFPTGTTSAVLTGFAGNSYLDVEFSGSGIAYPPTNIGLVPSSVSASAVIAGSITYAY